MGETCRLALLGTVLGCAGAFLAAHAAMNASYLAPSLASSQSQVALHPAAFVVSSLFLSAIAICASFAPARRALRVDPVVVLQGE
jgi:ABC-type antimicrobial peptide transport system permease subunit